VATHPQQFGDQTTLDILLAQNWGWMLGLELWLEQQRVMVQHWVLPNRSHVLADHLGPHKSEHLHSPLHLHFHYL
jgi:hypothetical protein